jgi:hypothetical protein
LPAVWFLGFAEALPGVRPAWVRPDPPRCCAGLQRMTTERSRSCSFPTPPASLSHRCVDPGVFRAIALGSVSLPGWLPLMALRSSSRISSVLRSVRSPAHRGVPVCSQTSSLEVRRPSGAPSSGCPCPDPAWPAAPLGVSFPAVPRREIPLSRRAARVVSNDLDGLIHPAPCEVFRSLTPMGFDVPASPARASPCGGMGPVCVGLPAGVANAAGLRSRVAPRRSRQRSVVAVRPGPKTVPSVVVPSAASGHRSTRVRRS